MCIARQASAPAAVWPPTSRSCRPRPPARPPVAQASVPVCHTFGRQLASAHVHVHMCMCMCMCICAVSARCMCSACASRVGAASAPAAVWPPTSRSCRPRPPAWPPVAPASVPVCAHTFGRELASTSACVVVRMQVSQPPNRRPTAEGRLCNPRPHLVLHVLDALLWL